MEIILLIRKNNPLCFNEQKKADRKRYAAVLLSFPVVFSQQLDLFICSPSSWDASLWRKINVWSLKQANCTWLTIPYRFFFLGTVLGERPQRPDPLKFDTRQMLPFSRSEPELFPLTLKSSAFLFPESFQSTALTWRNNMRSLRTVKWFEY